MSPGAGPSGTMKLSSHVVVIKWRSIPRRGRRAGLSKAEDMKPILFGCVVGGLLLALSSSHADAQSLAEIARQEKLRRNALAAKAAAETVQPKAYTNANLRGRSRLTTSAARTRGTEAGTDATEPSAAGTDATAPSEAAPEAAALPTDEAGWRTMITAVREELERKKLTVAALQNRADGLLTDFTARDDPAERSVIEQERVEALEEVDRTNAEIQQLDQDVRAIQEQARRAGIPAGWLR